MMTGTFTYYRVFEWSCIAYPPLPGAPPALNSTVTERKSPLLAGEDDDDA